MASTVISQFVPSEDGVAVLVKGTIGGVAHLYRRENRLFRNSGVSVLGGITPQAFAQEFASHYATQLAAIAVLANQTVTVPVIEGQTSAVVFGATPVAEVGYDQLEVTATVAGVSTVLSMSAHALIENIAETDYLAQIGRKFYDQAQINARNALAAANYIATFTTT